MIQAVVFDFDGLIFDSETHEYAVIRDLFAEHGAELPLDVWSQCIGREAGFFDPLAYLEEQLGHPLDRDELARVRRSRFLDRIAGEGPLPGVADTLARAHELGLRVGLASSSGREWVVGNLERLDLLQHFECVRTADDVQRVKPEPDLYLSALECLGVEPRHAVAFEDSPNGALAARRAGMHCVVVPNSVTAGLAFHDGHLRLDSMLQADLPALFERLVRAADAADESAA